MAKSTINGASTVRAYAVICEHGKPKQSVVVVSLNGRFREALLKEHHLPTIFKARPQSRRGASTTTNAGRVRRLLA
jgi:hypothetical protein